MKCLGLALSACCFSMGFAQTADQSLEPSACRALFTTSAGLTEPGSLELEFGGQKVYQRDGSEHLLTPAQFNLGLNPWVDFRLGWNGIMENHTPEGSRSSGGTDPLIGGQALALKQAKAGVDLGLAYWHKLPLASVEKGIGTGKTDDTLVATVSRTFGRWALDVNAGANWIGRSEGEGRVRQGIISCTLTCALAPGWNASFDTYAMAATELGPRTVSSILAVSRKVSPSLTCDVAVESGLTQNAPRLALNAGLVWRIGRLWQN